MAADRRKSRASLRLEAEGSFRDKERLGKRFQGANFFFLSVAEKFFFSFFSFAFRDPLECGFEGSRAPF